MLIHVQGFPEELQPRMLRSARKWQIPGGGRKGTKLKHAFLANSTFLLRKYTSKVSVEQELPAHLTAVVAFLEHL